MKKLKSLLTVGLLTTLLSISAFAGSGVSVGFDSGVSVGLFDFISGVSVGLFSGVSVG